MARDERQETEQAEINRNQAEIERLRRENESLREHR
jgi:hypothetical protein